MGFWIVAARVGLVALFTLGTLGTHRLGNLNGFFTVLENTTKASLPKLPGSSVPLKMDWTGFAKVDELLGVLIAVFSPMFDGQSPSLSLMGFHFFAQLYAIWALILIEAYRVGNVMKIIAFATITGILAENVAAAMIFPAWCILQLLVSPTVKSGLSPALRQRSILVHPTELNLLPWSIFIGAVVPVILAVALPMEAKGALYANGQFWILVRQFHPAVTAIAQLLLSIFVGGSKPNYTNAAERNKDVVKALRRMYAIVKYTCIVTHCGTLAIVIGSQHLPGLFTVEAQSSFDPVKLWAPTAFWSGDIPKVVTAADGLWTFLQWDGPVMTFSFLLWALAINRDALSQYSNASGLLRTLWRIITMSIIGGPTAAAATLLEERDELLLETPEPAHEKKS